jgi:YesN/AraC family two-component response regulator
MTDGMLKELEQYCQPFTLLFVEDDKMLQKNVQRSLGLLFNKVIVASNGQEGLEAYKNNDIDLVLTDINMPIMNGISMTKKIKEIRVNQPIIVLSAHKDFEYIYELLHLGISAYSAKDASNSKVLELIQKHKSMPYNYKSDAEDIKKVFGLSKKAFKKALTSLQDSGSIVISDSGISLKE